MRNQVELDREDRLEFLQRPQSWHEFLCRAENEFESGAAKFVLCEEVLAKARPILQQPRRGRRSMNRSL
eukprot:10150849-Lingulodinium_polyedra.AAC.1